MSTRGEFHMSSDRGSGCGVSNAFDRRHQQQDESSNQNEQRHQDDESSEPLSLDLINDNNATSNAFESQSMDNYAATAAAAAAAAAASGSRCCFRTPQQQRRQHQLAGDPRRSYTLRRHQRRRRQRLPSGVYQSATTTSSSCCCSSSSSIGALESLDCCAGSSSSPPPSWCPMDALACGHGGGGAAAAGPHVSPASGGSVLAIQYSSCDTSTIQRPSDFCELALCDAPTAPASVIRPECENWLVRQANGQQTIAGCGSNLGTNNGAAIQQQQQQLIESNHQNRCLVESNWSESKSDSGGDGLISANSTPIDLERATCQDVANKTTITTTTTSSLRETVCQLMPDGGVSLRLDRVKTNIADTSNDSCLINKDIYGINYEDDHHHHHQFTRQHNSQTSRVSDDKTTKSLARLSGTIKSFLGDTLRSFRFVGDDFSDKLPDTGSSERDQRQIPITSDDLLPCPEYKEFACSNNNNNNHHNNNNNNSNCGVENYCVRGDEHHHNNCEQQLEAVCFGQQVNLSQLGESSLSSNIIKRETTTTNQQTTSATTTDIKMSSSASGSGDLGSKNNQQQHSIEDTIKRQLQEQQHQIQLKQQQQQQQVANVKLSSASLQKLKQNKFCSLKYTDRNSTYCSSVGATLTNLSDPNYDSPSLASSMGMVNCSELNQLGLCANNSHQPNPDQRIDFKLNTNGNTETSNSSNNKNNNNDNNNNIDLNMPVANDGDGGGDSENDDDDSGRASGQCKVTVSNRASKSTSLTTTTIKKRENWDKNIEFLLAVIGFAVDLGNVWRFPYICYKNGGGAFLIPYTIMFILGGLPIFYLEMSLGQYFSCGCLTVWRRVCPMAKGIGYAMCVLNFFTGLYYNTIISWAVFFFVESFTHKLPWTSCDNEWNSPGCRSIEQRQEMRKHPFQMGNQTAAAANNQSNNYQEGIYYTSPTKDYFEREVLRVHLSSGIDDLGAIRKPLAIYLAIVFVCIYFAIWKGVKSTGKAVWITALLPYFVLIPLLIRGVFLEGAWLGIKYYLYPNWYKIFDVDVWVEAAKQIYFSLGPGFGTLMALSSYNKFNHNCRRDALIAASVNYFASFIAGLVIFAVLGYMATIESTSIEEVATEGPGLVFQVYPEGLATMQFSSMWSVLFFMMVITLGIDSTFGGLESVITGLCDEYPRVLRAHRGIFIGVLIIIIYLCSLPTTTHGGNYVIYILESYGTSLSLLFIVLIETIIVCWLYGTDKFCGNLEEMYGERPGPYWRICWKYISPTILLLIFIAACGQELDKYRTLLFGEYVYPSWAPTFGLLMTGSSVCCVPVYAIYYVKTKTTGPSLWERLKIASRPIEARDQKVTKDHCADSETDKIRDHDDAHLDTDI